MKSLKKRIASVFITVAVICSMSFSASAVSFTIPTSPINTDDGVIKTTAARAGQVAPLILGCNLVASSNLGASSGDYNRVNSILGVFGSSINDRPDPYLYNYNYNLYAEENQKDVVEDATVSEQQAEGTPATSDAALNILKHRPDLILNQGAGTGTANPNEVYSEVIATLPENTDADTSNDYSPSYYTCSISSLVFQCENLKNLAGVVEEICEDKNLTTRYGDPTVIASDYDKFVWGYYFYIQNELEKNNIEKKSVAVVSNTSDEGANWTLPAQATQVSQNKPNRLVEYTRDNTNLLNGTEEKQVALSDVLGCDVVVANGAAGKTLKAAASKEGYDEDALPLIIDTLPTCLYGMIMQTHENALGIPYIQSIVYADQLNLNPVYAAAYFYEHFFHITDQEALQETVNTLLASATLPPGVTTSIENYDPYAVEELIVEGINYAKENEGRRHDDPDVWNPDTSTGIGTEYSVEVQADGNGTVTGGGTYLRNAVVTVTAEPGSNQTFLGWYQGTDRVSRDLEYSFKVTDNMTLTGRFERQSSGGGSGGGRTVSRSEQYNVSVITDGNGTATGAGSFDKDASVTVTANPAEDSEFAGWYIGDQMVSDSLSYTFQVSADTELTAKFTVKSTEPSEPSEPSEPVDVPPADNPFNDVHENDYFFSPVEWAVENQITTGTAPETFSPEEACTRGQIVTFLWRAKGSPEPQTTANPFTDVQQGEYYTKAVLWAVEQGITNGSSATTFSPDDTVTRGQTVTFLWRTEGSESISVDNPFTDVPANQYYSDAVLWAVKNQITTGKTASLFGPEDPCTRAQIVTFLYRAFNQGA